MTAQLTVESACVALQAELLHSIGHEQPHAPESLIAGAANDARAVTTGMLFVALQGTRAHGAVYAQQAAENGAVAMLAGCDAPAELVSQAAGMLPVIRAADDAVAALGRLARHWRRACGFTVVGITGSVGKTSTKDILHGLLSPSVVTVASHANHNNEIGVPLTLLQAPTEAAVVICEMGMRGRGQIDYLCSIAEPDIGIVTNAGAAHVELLGTVEAVVAAKAELIAGVDSDGLAVVPLVQPELVAAAARTPRTLRRFGEADARAYAEVVGVHRTDSGIAGTLRIGPSEHGFELPLHGVHQARNLAAASCAYEHVVGSLEGLQQALAQIRLTAGRGDRYRLPDGGMLIDDAYNANPMSMRAALDELAVAPAQRRVAVLGLMAELGADSGSYHREAARHAFDVGVDLLVAVETDHQSAQLARTFAAAGGNVVTYPGADETAAALEEWWQPGDVVLVKASNSVGLSAVTQTLLTHARPEVRA